MSFFCAGATYSARSKQKEKAGGRAPLPRTTAPPPPPPPAGPRSVTVHDVHLPTIPHSNSPNSRKMIVLQEYRPEGRMESSSLCVKRGESVQVISSDGEWFFVRSERGREGFVPKTHLYAPRTSRTRTHSRGAVSSSSTAIRQVRSNSSVQETSKASLAMAHCHSTGRPRKYSLEDKSIRRVTSPPTIPSTTVSPPQEQGGQTSYEQKHSPSSSSGVATGPSSPSFTSQHHTSQEQDLRDTASTCSLNHSDRSSLSSYENSNDDCFPADKPQHPRVRELSPMMLQDQEAGGPISSDETLPKRGSCGSSSDCNLSAPAKMHSPIPPSPPPASHLLEAHRRHIYSKIEDSEEPAGGIDGTDPEDSEDPYSIPFDSLGPSVKPVRVMGKTTKARSLSDIRSHEVRPHNGLAVSRAGGGGETDASRYQLRQQVRPPHPQARPHEPQQTTKISKFRKCLWGLFVVLFDFRAEDENEVSVQAGEHVSVWNRDDQEWYWIVKHTSTNSEEGFIPSTCLREIVASDSKLSAVEAHHQKRQLPPAPVAKQQHPPAASAQVRPLSGHAQKTLHTFERKRINSESKVLAKVRRSSGSGSSSSTEKLGFPPASPSSPPPPYTEFDDDGPQPAFFPQAVGGGTHPSLQHRTRSHGQIVSRSRHHHTPSHTPNQLSLQRMTSPGSHHGAGPRLAVHREAEPYPPPSPTVKDGGGTLV